MEVIKIIDFIDHAPFRVRREIASDARGGNHHYATAA